MEVQDKYMRRAIQLARNGLLHASPNPMVGAVIVDASGNIIGEGYHRRCGEGHAEVNAIASVKCPEKLIDSTMYVTLEPCAHYGRTGPCSQLIIDKRIPRVVVGTRDPFDKVNGKGIEMMRNAGVEVVEDVLRDECRKLNAVFFTAHTQKRPFIMLKWAQTVDGYIDAKRAAADAPLAISSPLTRALSHRLRSIFDAILIGSGTALADNPSLDNRLWTGDSPIPVLLDRRGRVPESAKIMLRNPIIVNTDESLEQVLGNLYDRGISSLLVEGGAHVLQSFLDSGLWDIVRVETAPFVVSEKGGAAAPPMGNHQPSKIAEFEDRNVKYYVQNPLIDVKNI